MEELIITDPETGTEHRLFLNESDYQRALVDDTFISTLLEYAKKQPEEELNEDDETNISAINEEFNSPPESHSLLSPTLSSGNYSIKRKEDGIEEQLISLVQTRPALWDSRLPLMERTKTIKEKLWLEIYHYFPGNPSITLEILQKKWRNLKDTYMKRKLDVETYIPSGSEATKKKKVWKHFESLRFLSDTVGPQRTFSSLKSLNPDGLSTHEVKVDKTSNPRSMKRKLMQSSESSSHGTENILTALNKIVDSPEVENIPKINPICMKISDLLAKMPIKERTRAEIKLLQHAFDLSEQFI